MIPTSPRLDLDLALHGYVTGPHGGQRFVHGADVLARDTILYGCTLEWGQPTLSGRPVGALVNYWAGRIIFADWLYLADAPYLRYVWTHELAHVLFRTGNEERIREMQCRRWPDLLLPRTLDFTRFGDGIEMTMGQVDSDV